MNTLTKWLDAAHKHVQLLRARQDRQSIRRRAVGEPPPPRSQRRDDEDHAALHHTKPSGAQAMGTARGDRRPLRRKREVSLLTALAQAEEQNQGTVEKVWWLYRHHFLPAKQREVNLRRGLIGDAVDDAVDDMVNIRERADASFADEED